MSLVRLNIKSRIELETRVLAAALKQSFERGDSDGASLAHKQLFSLLKDVNKAQPGNIDCIRVSDGAPPGLAEAEESSRVSVKPVTASTATAVPPAELQTAEPAKTQPDGEVPENSLAAKLYSQPLFGSYTPPVDVGTSPPPIADDATTGRPQFMRNSARMQLSKQNQERQDETAEIVGYRSPEQIELAQRQINSPADAEGQDQTSEIVGFNPVDPSREIIDEAESTEESVDQDPFALAAARFDELERIEDDPEVESTDEAGKAETSESVDTPQSVLGSEEDVETSEDLETSEAFDPPGIPDVSPGDALSDPSQNDHARDAENDLPPDSDFEMSDAPSADTEPQSSSQSDNQSDGQSENADEIDEELDQLEISEQAAPFGQNPTEIAVAADKSEEAGNFELENFEVPEDDLGTLDVLDPAARTKPEDAPTGSKQGDRETSADLPVVRPAPSDAVSPRPAPSVVAPQTRSGEHVGGLYELLEVSQMSAFDEIHRNFLRKARLILREIRNNKAIRYDKLPELQKLWIAHDILTDPVTRTDYDFRDLGVRGTTEEIVHPPEDAQPVRLGARTPLRIGELLQAAGLIETAELEIACDMHKAMPEMQFGTFLVKQGFIQEHHLDAVLVGQKLLRAGAISVAQFQAAMEGLEEDSASLTDVLVKKGFISALSLDLTLNPPPPEEPPALTVQIREIPIAKFAETKTQEMRPAMPSWKDQLDWGLSDEEEAPPAVPAAEVAAKSDASNESVAAADSHSLGGFLASQQRPNSSLDSKNAVPSWKDQLDWGSDTTEDAPTISMGDAESTETKSDSGESPKIQLSNAVPTWKDQLDWGSPEDAGAAPQGPPETQTTSENLALAEPAPAVASAQPVEPQSAEQVVTPEEDQSVASPSKDSEQAAEPSDSRRRADTGDLPLASEESQDANRSGRSDTIDLKRPWLDDTEIAAKVSSSQFEIPPAPYTHGSTGANESLLPAAMADAFAQDSSLDIPMAPGMRAADDANRSDTQPIRADQFPFGEYTPPARTETSHTAHDDAPLVPEERGLFAHLIDKNELFDSSSAMLLGQPPPSPVPSHQEASNEQETSSERETPDEQPASSQQDAGLPASEVNESRETSGLAATSDARETSESKETSENAQGSESSEDDDESGAREPEGSAAQAASKREKRKKSKNKMRKRR